MAGSTSWRFPCLIQNEIGDRLSKNMTAKGRLLILSYASVPNGVIEIKYHRNSFKLVFKLGNTWSSISCGFYEGESTDCWTYEVGFVVGFKSDEFDPVIMEKSLGKLIDILEGSCRWSRFDDVVDEFWLKDGFGGDQNDRKRSS